MHRLVALLLIVVGLIHLLPLPGVLGGARLAALYGLGFDEPNLALLTRHRAVLFGLLGAFLLYAAFKPALHALALVAGAVSVMSFLLLAWQGGGINAQLQRVVVADIVALACLVVAAIVHAIAQAQPAEVA